MLTTGVDNIVGTAGKDTINANPVSAMTGSNTYTTTYPATQQIDKVVVDGTILATDTFDVTYKGVTVTSAATGGTTAADAAVVIADAINLAAGATIASVAGDTVIIAAPSAGTSLPSYYSGAYVGYYYVDKGTTGATFTHSPIQSNYPSSTQTSTYNTYDVTSAINLSDKVDGGAGYDTIKIDTTHEVDIGQAAVTNVEALVVTSGSWVSADVKKWDASLQTVNISAQDDVDTTTRVTTNVVVSTTNGYVTTNGGKDVTITGATNGVQVNEAKGAVSVDTAYDGSTSSSFYSTVYVYGGTTVTVNKAAAELDADGQPTGSSSSYSYNPEIQVGEDASFSNTSVTLDGYPEIDSNAKYQPTGNVTVNSYTAYVDTAGQAARVYNGGTVKVYSNGATDVSVANAGAITIKDVQTATRKATSTSTAVAGTSTLSSVTIDGSDSTVAVTSDALTKLKVVNAGSSSAVTVTNATTAGHALALTLGNNAGGSITDDTATAVTVTTEAQQLSTVANASKSTVDLNAAKATSLVFNNAQAVTLSGASTLDGATKVTSIVATGTGSLALGDISGATKLTSIDASAASGKLSVTIPATGNYGLTLKGGSANDTVTLEGALASAIVSGAVKTTSIDLGAGNDTVIKGTSGSIGAGAVVNGGEGTDTISSSLVNASNSSAITGFEILGLAETSGTYDTELLVGATGFAALAVGATYSNAKTSQGLTFATDLSSGTNTLTFGAAVTTGTADSYAITFAGTDAAATAAAHGSLNAQTLRIDGIESISIVSGGTGFIDNSITLLGANARTVTIAGDKDLTLAMGDGASTTATFGTAGTSTTANGVSMIDGSAATGKLSINTTDTDFGVAYAGLTIKGGSAADTITLGQKATVDAGAGNDMVITAAASSSTLTLGAGKDTLDATSTVYSTGYMTTITDIAVGDKIDFLGSTANSGSSLALGTKVTLGSTVTTLAAALDAAADHNGTGTTAEVSWFQYGGNTYVVFDAASGGTGIDTTADVVVKLTGLVDLSTATFNETGGLVAVA